MQTVQPLLGIIFMVGLCLLLSRNRGAALRHWRILVWGFGLQLFFALLVLKSNVGEGFFEAVKVIFVSLFNYANEGAQFVFGELADSQREGGMIFAFASLTAIIFFASLMAILYHLGIMQLVVKALAWIMARTMKISGAEALSAAGNIFVGMTEAPLTIRPFMPGLTRSEMMAIMTCGLATVAGTVMAVYISFLIEPFPDIAGHLMAASVMSAPAGLVFAKLLIPETETAETAGTIRVEMKSQYDNVVDAAAGGASEGMKLLLNILAMIVAFVALVAMANGILGHVSTVWFGAEAPLTIQKIFGWVFQPLAWLMGVPGGEAQQVGQLMGTKLILNEFLAYLDLQTMAETLSPRSMMIAAYALCGFANLGSVGITIGGLSILAPERRAEIARLGLPSMFAGFFACNTTACIAAILVPAAEIAQVAPTP